MLPTKKLIKKASKILSNNI